MRGDAMIDKTDVVRRFGYGGLLITLFGLSFLAPLVRGRAGEALLIGVLIVSTAGAAIYAAGGSRARQLSLAVLAVAYAVAHFHAAETGSHVSRIVHDAVGAVFFSFVTVVLLRRILTTGAHVSRQLIAGSVAVYLLLGMIFAYLYILVENVMPGAFSLPEHAANVNDALFYYSWVTLTTVGYGDITPVAPIARSLAALEALIGPLYLTVLVARLVGMRISATDQGADHSG
jgi:hypothetical protein